MYQARRLNTSRVGRRKAAAARRGVDGGRPRRRGHWRPGRSLRARPPAKYVGPNTVHQRVSTDLARSDARLQQTRAGSLVLDTLREENLPYRPPVPAPRSLKLEGGHEAVGSA
jgi:hypothetical protein